MQTQYLMLNFRISKYSNFLSYKGIQIYIEVMFNVICIQQMSKIHSAIIRRYKNKIINTIKIWWTIIIENKLHVIKIAKGIIKDRHIEGYISLHTQPCSIVLLNPKREHTNKIFFSLMTCDITSMYSKYVLGKFQIYNFKSSLA